MVSRLVRPNSILSAFRSIAERRFYGARTTAPGWSPHSAAGMPSRGFSSQRDLPSNETLIPPLSLEESETGLPRYATLIPPRALEQLERLKEIDEKGPYMVVEYLENMLDSSGLKKAYVVVLINGEAKMVVFSSWKGHCERQAAETLLEYFEEITTWGDECKIRTIRFIIRYSSCIPECMPILLRLVKLVHQVNPKIRCILEFPSIFYSKELGPHWLSITRLSSAGWEIPQRTIAEGLETFQTLLDEALSTIEQAGNLMPGVGQGSVQHNDKLKKLGEHIGALERKLENCTRVMNEVKAAHTKMEEDGIPGLGHDVARYETRLRAINSKRGPLKRRLTFTGLYKVETDRDMKNLYFECLVPIKREISITKQEVHRPPSTGPFSKQP